MPRIDGRSNTEHRPIEIIPGFQRNAEGSVLYRTGNTVVLCTASVDNNIPNWLVGKGKGWLTAEYQMHPRANPSKRESRDGRGKAPSGRTQEIQRLVGRALRSAIDLENFGERSISIDCDVLEADGGTRTASITASFIALALALNTLKIRGELVKPVLRDQVAAISVGCIGGNELMMDLNYHEDSRARVDMNVVATDSRSLIEVQSTAEGEAISRVQFDELLELATVGIFSLLKKQRSVLAERGIDLQSLFQRQLVEVND